MNVAGFSPFQLVLGTNPRLPSCITDDIPVITKTSTSKLIQENLNALHSARTAFISCENDEKIKRALQSNIRCSGEIKYVTGDEVMYKRDDSIQCHGPATVIGQVDQQVFLKHGSFHIRVHPCRMQLVRGAKRTVTQISKNSTLPIIDEPQPSSATTSSSKTTTSKISNIPVFTDNNASPSDHPIPIENNQAAALPNNYPVETPIAVPDGRNTASNDANNDIIDTNNQDPTNESHDEQPIANNEANDTNSDNQHTTISNPPLNSIKPGMKIEYQEFSRTYKNHPNHEATIKSRAGKASGKYTNCWNTTRQDGTHHIVDFSKVHSWQIKPNSSEVQDTNQEYLIDSLLITSKQSRELNAKVAELAQWKTMEVYKEVEDTGQDCISLRWVLKDKVDNEGNTFCKARLCVRGFEEEQDFRTDSPTCSREGIRLFFATTSSNKWKLHFMDVKGAFLQGKEIDREVTLRPPKEAQTTNLWRLIKCTYGLADAPRCWYLRMREELLNLGAHPSKMDNGIFLFIQSSLFGIIVLYVDDIMWSGIDRQMRPIIEKLKSVFKISHEDDDAFNYVGMQVSQDKDFNIHINQTSYVVQSHYAKKE